MMSLKSSLRRSCTTLILLTATFLPATAQDEINVMYALRQNPSVFEETGLEEDMISEGDAAQIELLEGLGLNLIFWDNSEIQNDPDEALRVADEDVQLVYVSESISSGRMATLGETFSPLISNENFGCDSLGITFQSEDGVGRVDGHGSPGTLNPDGFDLRAGTSFGTEVRIVDDTHPIAVAAGLANGDYPVYDAPGGRRSWCVPGEEAQIIATMPDFADDYPDAATLAVYEEGTVMADDRDALGMRIHMFLSDTNRGPELEDSSLESDGEGPAWEATLLTDFGKRLIEASLEYALGTELTGPEPIAPSNPLDLNGDAEVTAADVDLACAAGSALDPYFAELNSLAGDIDFDGQVAFSDFLALSTNFGSTDVPYTGGNINCDNTVDFADFLALSDAFGSSAGAQAASVPEPASVTMFLLGLLCASRLRKRGRA